MTVNGWIIYFIFVVFILTIAIPTSLSYDRKGKILIAVITVAICGALLLGMLCYFNYTESGKRKLVDQRSDFGGGLCGKIDIEGNDGGYVLFDFDGKRYTYYNCFVESIAEIQ